MLMTRDCAAKLVAEMLGMDDSEIDDEILSDGVGEIANIVAGHAKTKLGGTSFHYVNLAIPSIDLGNGSCSRLLAESAGTRSFRSDVGDFELAVTLAAAV